MSKHHRNQNSHSPRLTRREVLTRAGLYTSAVAAGSYVAWAPEDHRLSRHDPSGLRGLETPTPFRLPDFRVAKPANIGSTDLGIGRGSGGEPIATLLDKALDAIGGLRHYVQAGDVVLIKPNVAFDRAPLLGATTSPELIEALIDRLRVDCRVSDIRVADNPIESPADCFEKTGIRTACERAGARVYLPDSNAFDLLNTPNASLIKHWAFFRRPFKNVTKVIGVAPVKDHNLCHASLAIKNWYGLLGGRRNQFHQSIHEIIADLSIMIRPTLNLLDGTHVLMANGPTGGDPANVKNAGVILAAVDPVLLDTWAYRHLLERDHPLPNYLLLAQQRGVGRTDMSSRSRTIG